MKTLSKPLDLHLFGEEDTAPAEACAPVSDGTEDGVSDHRARLEEQARDLRHAYPDFDLERELCDPMFESVTALGMSVEDAYFAMHHKEILEAAVREATQKTAEKIAGAIRSGSRRPSESGGSSQASSVSTFDYSKASKAQREAFKKDLLTRMARGEKVYPTRYR